jgi:PAS domain S-box-containing protein
MSLPSEDILLEAARVVSGARIESVFADLIRAATELLDCHIGIVGRYVEVAGVPSIQTLACFANGRFVSNHTYPLAGTPCETAVGQEFRFYPSGVGFLFPEVSEQDALIEGYAAYPLFDREHRPLGIIAVMRHGELDRADRAESLLRLCAQRAVAEIERSEAAAALRASEEQYRAIFNASMDGLVLLELDGRIVDVNPAIERLYGFQQAELVGRNVLDVLARNRRDEAIKFMHTVRTKGYAQTRDHATRKDGTEFFCEPRAVLMDYRGETHMLAIVRDITIERQRERALRQSEELLRATVESGFDCIIAMDAKGIVREFNPAAERCFGYRREDAIGREVCELIIPERFRAEHRATLAHFLATGEGLYFDRRRELVAMRAGGEEFTVELAMGLARGAAGPTFIGYLRDITERLAAERERQVLENQLRQAQKMEAIGHLTGGIAHDFNNILTSVLGYVELAAGKVADGDERVTRYLERARRSGERARDLVQQMLTFSRGQQGEPRSVCLEQVVEEGLQLLESTLPSTLRIETQIERGLPRTLADPVHLEQVLVNLCINARDAMAGHGTLHIALRRTEPDARVCTSCQQPVIGDFLELVVRDSGSGMSPEIVERIFEPFFSTKEIGRGSGMGLSTVHGIVHECRGHVVVETAPGAGSAFSVFLPVESGLRGAEDAAPSAVKPVDDGTMRGRVLVVDDNIAVAGFLDELLSDWGLTVTTSNEPGRALACFEELPSAWDLIVVDQTMPRITGLELARRMLQLAPNLPIVLYTGYAEALTEQSACAAGVRALVRKPLDIPRLRTLIRELLAGAH